MNTALFCYGTLQFPEVMERVTGRRFESTPAVLAEFARYRIENAVYPGVIAENGAATEGVLYFDVDSDSLHHLDVFEGAPYVRRQLPVCAANGETVMAEVYVIDGQKRTVLTQEPWDKQEFSRFNLQTYLARIKPK